MRNLPFHIPDACPCATCDVNHWGITGLTQTQDPYYAAVTTNIGIRQAADALALATHSLEEEQTDAAYAALDVADILNHYASAVMTNSIGLDVTRRATFKFVSETESSTARLASHTTQQLAETIMQLGESYGQARQDPRAQFALRPLIMTITTLPPVQFCAAEIDARRYTDPAAIAYLNALNDAHSQVSDLIKPDPHSPMGPDAPLRARARESLSRITEIRNHQISRFRDQAPLRVSPGMRHLPQSVAKATDAPIGPGEFSTGYLVPSEVSPHHNSFLHKAVYISFIHEGSVHVKLFQEPYPKRFSSRMAHVHAAYVLSRVRHQPEDPEAPPPSHRQRITDQGIYLAHQAARGMTQLAPSDLQQVIDTAHRHQVSPAVTHNMLRLLLNDHHDLLPAALPDQDPQSFTAAECNELTEHARQAGLSPANLRAFAYKLRPSQPFPEPHLTPEGIDAITTAAQGFIQLPENLHYLANAAPLATPKPADPPEAPACSCQSCHAYGANAIHNSRYRLISQEIHAAATVALVTRLGVLCRANNHTPALIVSSLLLAHVHQIHGYVTRSLANPSVLSQRADHAAQTLASFYRALISSAPRQITRARQGQLQSQYPTPQETSWYSDRIKIRFILSIARQCEQKLSQLDPHDPDRRYYIDLIDEATLSAGTVPSSPVPEPPGRFARGQFAAHHQDLAATEPAIRQQIEATLSDVCLQMTSHNPKVFSPTSELAIPAIDLNHEALTTDSRSRFIYLTDPSEEPGDCPPLAPPQCYGRTYVQYHHLGTQHMQAIGDPYPHDVPHQIAVGHAAMALKAAQSYRAQNPEAYHHPAATEASILSVMAISHLHHIKPTDLAKVLAAGRDAGLSRLQMEQAILRITMGNRPAAALIALQCQDVLPPLAELEQANSIVAHAAKMGLDHAQITIISHIFGIPTGDQSDQAARAFTPAARRALTRTLERSGIPPATVQQILKWPPARHEHIIT